MNHDTTRARPVGGQHEEGLARQRVLAQFCSFPRYPRKRLPPYTCIFLPHLSLEHTIAGKKNGKKEKSGQFHRAIFASSKLSKKKTGKHDPHFCQAPSHGQIGQKWPSRHFCQPQACAKIVESPIFIFKVCCTHVEGPTTMVSSRHTWYPAVTYHTPHTQQQRPNIIRNRYGRDRCTMPRR